MSKQPPPAPTASAVSPCPTMIQISWTPRHWKFTQHHRTTPPPPGTESLPSTFAPPDHPRHQTDSIDCTSVSNHFPSSLVEEGGGAMVLGKLPVPGRPAIWITVGQGPTALAVSAGGGCLDILLSSILSFLFLPLFGRRPDID